MTKKIVTENMKRAAERKTGVKQQGAHGDGKHHHPPAPRRTVKPAHEMTPVEAFIERLSGAGVGEQVLEVMTAVDRPSYFDPAFADAVYGDEPVQIGFGQKSDAPVDMARMIHRLAPGRQWRVLEVGTGSGYATAVLARLCREVVTIDCIEELVGKAKERLITDGCRNIRFFVGEVSEDMMPDLGSFDGIVLWAACGHTPFSIVNLLKDGGVAVFPMGPAHQQQIIRYVHRPGSEDMTRNFTFHDFCLYGPIRGRYGWKDRPAVPATAPEGTDQPAGSDKK